MTTAADALKRLNEGNQRFVSGISSSQRRVYHERRKELVAGQSPYAIILGCADSRVPVNVVFDEGLGDLFVIRVAGNIVDEAITGSVEYAAANLGSKLVVVLGHTHCGAVAATLQEMQQPTNTLSSNLRFIVDSIEPAVQNLANENSGSNSSELVSDAVKVNVLQSVANLQATSSILTDLVATGGLKFVGARYDLESGVVEFFDDAS